MDFVFFMSCHRSSAEVIVEETVNLNHHLCKMHSILDFFFLFLSSELNGMKKGL